MCLFHELRTFIFRRETEIDFEKRALEHIKIVIMRRFSNVSVRMGRRTVKRKNFLQGSEHYLNCFQKY